EVRHHLALVGVGADQILTQRHRLLRGMDAAGHRGKRQHVAGEPPPVGRAAPAAYKLPIVGTQAALGRGLIRPALFKLRVVGGELLIKHQNVFRFFQRHPAGVEKPRPSPLEPYP
ncbi:Anaerobic benzoate catabolism transcriptional regulator, partial [Dysosmobacter welbionis]